METNEVVTRVYALLAQRDLRASARAIPLARAGLEGAAGPGRLALAEALTEAIDALLTELGEHGRGPELAEVDVALLTEEWASAFQEVVRLRATGLDSEALISPFVGGWMVPIGSREWVNQQRRAVAHRTPAWVARVSALRR